MQPHGGAISQLCGSHGGTGMGQMWEGQIMISIFYVQWRCSGAQRVGAQRVMPPVL